jgi:hypothetical protein
MIVFVIGMFYLEKKFWKQTMGRIIFIKANYLATRGPLFMDIVITTPTEIAAICD